MNLIKQFLIPIKTMFTHGEERYVQTKPKNKIAQQPPNMSKAERRQSMSVQKSTDSSSLAEVIDRILDKGIVIDAFVRVSLVGIEILTVEARVVIASVDTWLRYAEAVGLLSDEAETESLAYQNQSQTSRLSY